MSDKYAVIGHPVRHSKSPLIHLSFARQTGQDVDYGLIEADPGGFREAAEHFRLAGACGMNVTTPFKLDAFAYASDLSEQARLAGAVNALKFVEGRIHAQNFDGSGLVRDIVCNLDCPLQGRRVLLLGAGGAARGAILPLLQEKPARLLLVNRTASKAATLVEQFLSYADACRFGFSSYADLENEGEIFDVVINATSASLHDELPQVPRRVFSPHTLAYEMTYGKGLTPFLRCAQAAGAGRWVDGVGMLVEQAADAFAWWRGIRPETAAVIAALTIPLR